MGSLPLVDGDIGQTDLKQICDWNGPPLPRGEGLLHALFEGQAHTRPKAVAVDAWDGAFTYSELDQMSTTLGHHLQTLGVGPEAIVPLCFQKSKYMIVAMVGVLKAGGAFCPLEPGQPRAITAEILGKVGAELVLCSETCNELCQSLLDDTTVLTINASVFQDIRETTSHSPASTDVSGTNAAYVFFTSGSTGKPKGCVNTHGGCCVSFTKQAEAMFVGEDSRLLHRASFCFDAFLCETMVGLVAGACICIPSEAAFHGNPTKAIADYRATWALFLPSFLGQIDRAAVPCLTTLVLGVEVMSDYHISEWSQQARLLNAYGLTECAVVSTVASHVVIGSDPRSIGSPIGVHAWVVDADDHNILLPPGQMGELTLSGPALGRGYLGDELQTKAAYIPSPAWMPETYRVVEQRLFKTGDLVRQATDGSIICLGRRANLIKYEGSQLIAHEVEFYLQSLMPSAAQFVVEILELPIAGPSLVAFVGLRQDSHGRMLQLKAEDAANIGRIAGKDIPEQLREVSPYPDNCWPSVFVPCFPLPKKWSGKANRVVLRETASSLSEEELQEFRNVWKSEASFRERMDTEWPWLLTAEVQNGARMRAEHPNAV